MRRDKRPPRQVGHLPKAAVVEMRNINDDPRILARLDGLDAPGRQAARHIRAAAQLVFPVPRKRQHPHAVGRQLRRTRRFPREHRAALHREQRGAFSVLHRSKDFIGRAHLDDTVFILGKLRAEKAKALLIIIDRGASAQPIRHKDREALAP